MKSAPAGSLGNYPAKAAARANVKGFRALIHVGECNSLELFPNNVGLRGRLRDVLSPAGRVPTVPGSHARKRRPMFISVAHLQPIVALIAGVLILAVPRLLNYIVAAFLIVSGVIGLGLLR